MGGVDLFKKIINFLSNRSILSKKVGIQRFDRVYEEILQNERSLKIVAFIIILLMYWGIKIGPNLEVSYAEDIRGKTLNVTYDEELYVVEGLPKTVDVTVQGKKSLVRNIVTTNSFNTYVDLSNLKPGHHLVEIKYESVPSGVSLDVNPKNVSILIKELVKEEMNVDIEYLNQKLLDPTLVFETLNVSTNQVLVKGAGDTIKRISKVKGYIDLSLLNENENTKESTRQTQDLTSKIHKLKIPLYALDSEGNKLNVTIEPSEIEVSFDVSKPQKTVQLKPKVIGDLPDNKVVEKIEVFPSKVDVYAPEDVLEKITDVSFDVDITGLSEDFEATFVLTKPNDVSQLSEESVAVKVYFSDASQKQFEKVKVGTLNLDAKLKVENEAELFADIRVSGLKSAVDNYALDELVVALDLKGLGEGTHLVPVKIINKKQNLTYDHTETMRVVLTKK